MLEPYIVLDFTDERGEIGPMMLGDLGADVIRIEPPEGSSARRTLPLREDDSASETDSGSTSLSFICFNRNKRSIVLDPESAADNQILKQLIQQAHFVFNSAPNGGLAAYGFDHDGVAELNANLVFVEISPFGRDGPHADYLGNDLVVAAMGGPVALQGVPERAPVRLSVPQVWRHAGAESAVAPSAPPNAAPRTDVVAPNVALPAGERAWPH